METDSSQPNVAESNDPDPNANPASDQRAPLGKTPAPNTVDLPHGAQPRELPSKFGRYEIGELLGSGSTGAVYQALDPKLERQVAIKVPHHFADDSPEVVARFQREARAAAKLAHPNICPIYDVGEIGGIPYITMAFVEGQTLGECLQSAGPLPETDAAKIVLRLAGALAEAHDRGLVHRNLKLSNILVDDRDEPIITDFGLARQANADETTIRVTQTGKILGTLAYMSPEQLLESPGADTPGTDIYSLGVILYRLLSGRLPFEGPSPVMIAKILSHDPPPLQEHRPRIHPDLAAICLKALAKKVEERYASMAEYAESIRTYLRSVGELDAQSAAESTNRIRRRTPASTTRSLSAVVRSLRKRIPADRARRRALFATVTWIAVTLLVVLTTALGFWNWNLSRDRLATAQRMQELEDRFATAVVDTLVHARPESVQVALENLGPFRERARPRLERYFAGDAPVSAVDGGVAKTRAAYALILFTNARPDVLEYFVRQIGEIPDGETQTYTSVALHAGDAVLKAIRDRFASSEREQRARYALVALCCGASDLAGEVLRLQEDPTARTAFVHNFPRWHGDLAAIATILAQDGLDPDLSSGLCSALGLVTNVHERRKTRTAITRLYQHAPDGGTHGAAAFALKRWKETEAEIEIPELDRLPCPPDEDRGWYVNSLGMTMVRIPAGEFWMGDDHGQADEQPRHRITLTRSYYLGNCEVAEVQYSEFAKERDLKMLANSEPNLPVVNVTWDEAVEFCNWLSQREGLTACYATSAGRCDFTADGYRLPTEAEWEYACRARSTTQYGFGDSAELL